ncbi:MAG: metallophosphoesterase family protein [Fusobacteriota bacterium]
MKILVLSDSHGDFLKLNKIYNKEKPDYIFFCGDFSKDGIELSYIANVKKTFIVKGNTDRQDYKTPTKIETKIKERKFFLTHGHLFGVKSSYNDLINYAKDKYDIVIFGHTHLQEYFEYEKVHLFNPGAVKDGEYGVIEMDDENLEFKHYKI